MIREIISGGQFGADIAGLLAAKELGMERTGNIHNDKAHKRRVKRAGAACRIVSSYKDVAGLKARTEYNVINSNATILFTTLNKSSSPGSRLTKRLAEDVYKKPFFHFIIEHYTAGTKKDNIKKAIKFLLENDPEILNIAGNRNNEKFEDEVKDIVIIIVKAVNNKPRSETPISVA